MIDSAYIGQSQDYNHFKDTISAYPIKVEASLKKLLVDGDVRKYKRSCTFLVVHFISRFLFKFPEFKTNENRAGLIFHSVLLTRKLVSDKIISYSDFNPHLTRAEKQILKTNEIFFCFSDPDLLKYDLKHLDRTCNTWVMEGAVSNV